MNKSQTSNNNNNDDNKPPQHGGFTLSGWRGGNLHLQVGGGG